MYTEVSKLNMKAIEKVIKSSSWGKNDRDLAHAGGNM